MTTTPTPQRRRAQRGAAVRGVLVVVAVLGAVALQVAGAQLQSRLASLVGIARLAPTAASAGMNAPMPSHGIKVSQVVAMATCHAPAPVI